MPSEETQSAAGSTIPLPHPTTPPSRIGPYHILEHLGEGGMGTVYKAEQRTPVKRTVALKLIKPGFDTAEVIARFQSERQALARMDHPNVAKVLDAGADDLGRPYFMMEYVPGVPITKFADENKLSIRDRLLLFIQVCEAIAHAHTKAIIHRDIKASNVLAYLADGKPIAKVIDFGVAKALTGDRLTDRTFNTDRGDPIGTYECMSPEQAIGSPDIDTRTDVYSLGVLLYELLTGVKPFDPDTLPKAADQEIRRIIREVEPPRPSTKLSSLGDAATKIAGARREKLDALTKQLRAELEWIPLMALRKERDRRYASPLDLSEDIRNYLSNRPLNAGPESCSYRLQKFTRRNRPALLIAATFFLIIGLAIGLYIQGIRTEQRKTKAALNETENQRVLANRAQILAQQQARQAEASAYDAALFAADLALRSGNVNAAKRRLDAAPVALRHLEWHWFNAQTDASSVTLPRAGFGAGGKLYLDPSEQLLVARSSSSINEYAPNPWRVVASHRTLPFSQADLMLHQEIIGLHLPSRRMIRSESRGWGPGAWGGGTAAASLLDWDQSTPIELKKVTTHPARAVFSNDGKWVTLLSSVDDRTTPDDQRTLRLWDTTTGEPRMTLPVIPGNIWAVSFSSDDRLIAIGSRALRTRAPCLHVYEVSSGRLIFDLLPGNEGIYELAFTADDKLLVAALQKRVAVIDLQQQRPRLSIPINSVSPPRIAVSRDGSLLAVGTENGSVTIFDAASAETKNVLLGHTSTVQSITFFRSNHLLASTESTGIVKIWNLQQPPPRRVYPTTKDHKLIGFVEGQQPLLLSMYSARNAATDTYGAIEILDPATEQRTRIGVAKSYPLVAAIAPKTSILAVGLKNGTIQLHDARGGALIRSFDTNQTWLTALCFSPDEMSLAVGSMDGAVSLRKVSDGSPILQVKQPKPTLETSAVPRPFGNEPGSIAFLEFAQSGQVLLVVAAASQLRDERTTINAGIPTLFAVKIPSGEFLWQWRSQIDLGRMSTVGPDVVGLASDDRRVLVYLHIGKLLSMDLRTGALLHEVQLSKASLNWQWRVRRISLSPDSQRLALSSPQESILRILDMTNFTERLTIPTPASAALWSADGRKLALQDAGPDQRTIEILDTSQPPTWSGRRDPVAPTTNPSTQPSAPSLRASALSKPTEQTSLQNVVILLSPNRQSQ